MPEHETDLYQIPAAQRVILLQNMLSSPAFALFCDAWDEHLRTQVDAKIFDVKTDDATTRELKAARTHLTGTRHPRHVLGTLIRTTTSEKPKSQPSI